MMAELERAWPDLDADPAVRVIVNTGNGPAFQTGLDVAQLSRDPDGPARAVPPHQAGRAAPHRVAQPGVEAGDRGGQRHVRRRWPALRGRRRHRDRGERRHVPRPPRVGRPGDGLRGDRPGPEVADGADRAHGAHRPPRAHHRRAGPPARHPRRGRRPARAAARGAQELAETVAENSPAAMAATKRALWGALEHGLTDACKAGARSWCRCGATPTRTRARWPSPRREPTGHADIADIDTTGDARPTRRSSWSGAGRSAG